MVTRAQFATLALALPETAQASHFGQPDFRVRGKIFANLDRALDRAVIKIQKDLQLMLVASRPEVFVPASGAWGNAGWTQVELAQVRLAELRELVADAWRQIAPQRLVQTYDAAAGEQPSTTPKKTACTTRGKATKKRTKRTKRTARSKAPRAR